MKHTVKQLCKWIPAVLLIVAILILSASPGRSENPGARFSGGKWSSIDVCRELGLDYSGVKPLLSEKEQTILIYMVGSNLESEDGCASLDLLELLESDVDTAKCNVVIFTGGTNQWQSTISASSNSVMYLVGKGENRDYYTAMRTNAAMDMADPTTLAYFLNIAYRMFPAKQYNLVLWDHGGGVLGYATDEISRHHMGLYGLADALEHTPFKKNPLEWVAFDACLMGSLEVAVAVKNYARYLVASEEATHLFGLDYSTFGKVANQRVGGVKASRCIAEDAYQALVDVFASIGKKYELAYTYSCIDLSKIDAVQKAMETLFAQVNKNLSSCYSSYCAFLTRLSEFGWGDPSGMVDFTVYAKYWEKQFPEASKALVKAIRAAIPYNKATDKQAFGLAVYSVKPEKSDVPYEYAQQEYQALSVSAQYLKFMNAFLKQYKTGGNVNWNNTKPNGESNTTAAKTTSTTAKPKTTVAKTTTKPQTTKGTAYVIPSYSVDKFSLSSTSRPSQVPYSIPSYTVDRITTKSAGKEIAADRLRGFLVSGQNGDSWARMPKPNTLRLSLTDGQAASVASVQKLTVECSADAFSVRTVSGDASCTGNMISADFDDQAYYLESGGERIPLYLRQIQQTDDKTVYEADVSVCRTTQFQWTAGTSCALIVIFDEAHPDGYIAGLRFRNATESRVPVELREGYVLRSTYFGYRDLERDENGNVRPFAARDDTGYFHSADLVIGEDVRIVKAPVEESRELYSCVCVQDVYGYTFYSDFIPIER